MERLAAWVLTYWLHSTLLIATVAAAMPLLRRRPDVASVLWKTALLGGILTASVQVGFGVRPWLGSVDLGNASAKLGRTEQAARHANASVAPASVLGAAVEPKPVGTPSAPAATVVRLPAATASMGRSSPTPLWTWIAAALPLAGLGLGLGSLVLHGHALRRRLRGRVPVRDGPLRRLLAALLRRHDTRRDVALSIAPELAVPLATGVLRPEIVVPPRATHALSPAQQETLLAHELGHVLRRDPLWRIVALLIERVLFFQPLNKVAASGLAQAAEYLCDDFACRHTGRPLDLARCLTEVAGWSSGNPAVIGVAATGDPQPRSALGRRVQRLLQPRRLGSRWAPPGVATLSMVALLAIGWMAPSVATGKNAAIARSGASSAVLAIGEHGIALTGTDEDGTYHLVVSRDGLSIVAPTDAPAEQPPQSAKEKRKAKRAKAKARRTAKREIKKAFRRARKEGRAAPDPDELAAIARDARATTGRGTASQGHSFEFHIVIPDGDQPKIVVRGGMTDQEADAMKAEIEREIRRHHREAIVIRERAQRHAHRERERARRELRRELEAGQREAKEIRKRAHEIEKEVRKRGKRREKEIRRRLESLDEEQKQLLREYLDRNDHEAVSPRPSPPRDVPRTRGPRGPKRPERPKRPRTPPGLQRRR